MSEPAITLTVRKLSDGVSVVDVVGDITARSEETLTDAFARASADSGSAVVLNFTQLEYMNSGGIGVLVTLLMRANRQSQRLLAYGLSDHYREIFSLTRLDEAIAIHASESEAAAAL